MSSTSYAILPIADFSSTARTALAFLRPHRSHLFAAIGLLFLLGLAGIISPYALGAMVDIVTGASAQTHGILWWAFAIAAAALVVGISSWLSAAQLGIATNSALASLRESVLSRTLSLDVERIEAAGIGDVLSRVGDDVRQLQQSLEQALPTLVQALITISFTIVGLATLDWRLALAGLSVVPLYIWSMHRHLKVTGPKYREERVAQGVRAEKLVSSINGADTLREFNRTQNAVSDVVTASEYTRSIAVSIFDALTRLFGRFNFAEFVGLSVILVTGFLLVRFDLATAGAATAATLFFHRLFNPIAAVLLTFDEVQSAGASLTRLVGVLQTSPTESTVEHPTAELVLELANLRHEYRADDEVLHGVNLAIKHGQHIALVGATGAGKSTLAAIAAGTVRATSGTVKTVTDRLLVTQEIHVFACTIKENITLAKPNASDREVQIALEKVEAWPWVSALAQGLDTRVGHLGVSLTSAQAQHLALARIALRAPRLTILDEATAEAGSAGARSLDRGARKAIKDSAALIVAHRLSQAREADLILVMNDGHIVEQGNHEELLKLDGRYAQLWQAWE